MEEVMMFGSLEEMVEHERVASAAAIARITPKQWEMCDGKEHFAFYIDDATIPFDPQIGVCRIKSRQEILDGEFPEEVSSWFDENGVAARGYLPCETWDAYYNPVDPDIHDRHASILMEITWWDFIGMATEKWSFQALVQIPYFRDLFRDYATMRLAVANDNEG